ncbi:MAG: hypothetical protein FJ104_11905, partial [Deltaproteobacteria bacterium]|nr:hypothetical protein [Deltaproteobacteria bacterium]
MDSWLPTGATVWGIFPRLLGLVLGVSFASLLGQVVPIAGPDGVMPARDLLAAVRRDFPAPRRYLHFPTLLWISSSAAALRGVCLLGLIAAASIVVGGPHVPFAFLICALLYLTLDRSVGLVFPWDCALFEAVWFATLLPAPEALPELTASAVPAPALAFAYRLLVLRILLGFGKFKFLGSTARDWG